MPLEAAMKNVAKATVQFRPYGGQGVLVSGGFVLTASHCILDPHDGAPIRSNYALLSDPLVIEIETRSAERYKVMPVFVDAISDVAVLGALDHPDLFIESGRFEKLCESLSLARVSRRTLNPDENCGAWIHTHDQGWVAAEVKMSFGYFMTFVASSPIASNTSGGPIVDEDGKILGVVSESSEGADEPDGQFGSASLCLPVWLSRIVFNDDASDA